MSRLTPVASAGEPGAGPWTDSALRVDDARPAADVVTGRSLYVHLPHGLQVAAYADRFRRGLEPDRSPYGFHLAEELGYAVVYSTDHRGRFGDAMRWFVRRALFSIDVVHAFRNRQAIREADVIWTMLDSEGLAIALLMSLGVVSDKPLIGNLVWMFDRWNRYGWLRRTLHRALIRRFKVLTVHSRACLERSARILPDIDTKLMYFGVNADAFPVTPPKLRQPVERIEVLGIGNDSTRDWATFLRAFGDDARFSVKLVCRHVADRDVAHLANVELIQNPSLARFRDLYRTAHFVVVPMFENIFSGITVALEAAALGVPVICTRTGGVPTYFDESEVRYVPVGDAETMRDAAVALSAQESLEMAERAQRRFVVDDYSTRGMMERYRRFTDA